MRVAIATTEGPSRVQALAAETVPDVQSVVCVDGGADALSISAAYNRFLRRPTGPVEAAFGHRTFRLDVSARIAGGSSWQLGVYIAHALHAAGRLTLDAAAAPGTPVLLATGQVNRWGWTGSIDYLSHKLHAARPWLAELRAQGTCCTVAYPSADNGQIAPDLHADLEQLGVRLLPCDDVNDLERALDLNPASLAEDAPPAAGLAASSNALETAPEGARGRDPAVRAPDPGRAGELKLEPPAPGRRRRRWLGGAAGAGALLAAAVGWLFWQAVPLVQAARAGDYVTLAEAAGDAGPGCLGCALFRAWAQDRQPPGNTLELSATALRPSDRRSCDQARWSGDRLSALRVSLAPTDTPARLSRVRLCELRYDLANRGARAVPAVLALLDARGQTLASTSEASLPPGDRIELFVDPRRLSAAEGPFELVAYASGFASGNLGRALTPILDTGSPESTAPRLAATLALVRVSARHTLQTDPEPPAQAPSKTSDAPAPPRFQ